MSRAADDAPIHPRDLRAPEIANTVALAALFAISAAFLFAAYCFSRALAGGFGAGVGTIALSVASTAAASIFLWWFVPFADFAEIFWVHLPADRRARRNACPHCGYPHEGRTTCSECGLDTDPLPAWTLTRRPVRRLAAILVPALVLGATAGELWMRLDESRFVREYESVRAPYARARAFPTAFARMWADESGDLHAEAWPDFARDRRWKPKDPGLRERGWGWRGESDDAPR
ncbi:MAG: hypothetical protein RL136_2136 [Planctomycetota bacterium]|jgi:hypothetical protein